MRQIQLLGAMRHSSSVDFTTRGQEETRASSVELDSARRRRADQLKGTKAKAEREKEIKAKMEKGRAAAWAWYQHGKGGRDEQVSSSTVLSSTSVSVGGSASSLSRTVRANERGNKSSRFRTEALETSGHSISALAPDSAHLRKTSSHRRTESADRSWDFSNVTLHNRTSSLFDSHELNSMSKIIDIAVQRNGSTFSNPTSSDFTVHQGKGFPPAVPSPGASAQYVKGQVIDIQDGAQALTGRSLSEVTKGSSSFRMAFSRYSCGSVADVVTEGEMSLGGKVVRNDGQKTRATATRERSSWNPRIARVHSLPRV